MGGVVGISSALVVGPIFTNPGGHPATTICAGFPDLCRDSVAVEVDDAQMAREKVGELAAAGVDAIKAVYQDRPDKLADNVLAAIADEADRHDLPLIVHAPVAADARRALELGADRLVHPPIRPLSADLGPISQALRERSIPFSNQHASTGANSRPIRRPA